uniref:Uncharacterized protein n=1 Tax=Leptobrachium leishanense TaxID=445787 RepID=A0A8C5MYW8_9ANUR
TSHMGILAPAHTDIVLQLRWIYIAPSARTWIYIAPAAQTWIYIAPSSLHMDIYCLQQLTHGYILPQQLKHGYILPQQLTHGYIAPTSHIVYCSHLTHGYIAPTITRLAGGTHVSGIVSIRRLLVGSTLLPAILCRRDLAEAARVALVPLNKHSSSTQPI